LRKLAFRIVHSSTLLLPAWKALLEELELKVRVMPRDILTRWNSTFDMLDFAIEYQQALDIFTGDRKLGLHKFELSEKVWKIATQLHDTLLTPIKILKDATTYFSCATPNLATVIPAMDHIDKSLTTHSFDKNLNSAIRAALAMGKKTLDRYYSLTDSSQTYHIAMVLHLRHKLSYFKTAGWEAEWIQTASDLVRHEFDFAYADMPTSSADEELAYGEHESQLLKVCLILFNQDCY
ncbi:hypothetical protein DFJ58DRAFT_667157, partial [Suillus subalutaceus]|uniref:uncharacterized protein n=1 Tax=Suillus subalutaceus TaxID=48586 RepID=UPI001B8694FF